MKLTKCWIIVMIILAVTGCGKKTLKHDVLPHDATVLAFGDSVTYGYGASKGADYPTQLAALTGWKVINAGVSGERANQAKQRIADTLQTYQPKLVIVEIGGNDFLQRRSEKEIKEDIRSIIETIKEQNIPVVLVGVPNLSLMAVIANRPSDATLYEELAEEENITLIPDVFSNVLRDASLKSDQIHPNAKGYKQLAEGIAERLKEVGLR